jgi:hypothetical protein
LSEPTIADKPSKNSQLRVAVSYFADALFTIPLSGNG